MTDTTPSSPLENADAAKRNRDTAGEIDALTQGHGSLESAPWSPAQEGDLVHVHYPALGTKVPAWGETYAVEADSDGFLELRALHHTAPGATAGAGSFAPGLAGKPLMEMWMEAGPHALVVVRDGRVVHPTP